MKELYWRYFALLYVHFINGWYFSSYGVLIPYYSLATGRDETQFSYTFLVRSLAFITGSLTAKKIVHMVDTHRLYMTILVVYSVSLLLCSLSVSSINLSIMLFLNSFCNMVSQILIFSIIIQMFKGRKPQFYILLAEVLLGIGASFSSPFVIWLGLHTYQLLGILFILPIIFHWKYPIQNLQEQAKSDTQTRAISRKTELLISTMLLLYAGESSGYTGWIPTYSIKAGVSTPQKSSIYNLLFWFPNALLRIVWVLVPWQITTKLKIALLGYLVASFIFLFVQYYQYYQLLCIASALALGVLTSAMYSFYLTMALDNGFTTTTSNNATFMFYNCIGEALFGGPIGMAMSHYGFGSLFVILFSLCLINFVLFILAEQSMVSDKGQHSQLINLIQIPLCEVDSKTTLNK